MQAETGVERAMAVPRPAEVGPKTLGIQLKPGVLKLSFYGTIPVAFTHNLVATALTGLTPFLLVSVFALDRAHLGKVQGTLKTCGEIGYVLLATMIGALADRYGRRVMLLVSFGVAALAILGFAYAHVIARVLGVPAMPLLYGFRVVAGILYSAAFLYIVLLGDYTSLGARGKALAFVGMFGGIGSVTAQSFLGLSREFSAPQVIALLCPILAVCMGLVLWMIRDYQGSDRRPVGQRVDWSLVWSSLREEVGLRAIYLASFLTRADLSIITAFTVAWAVVAATQVGMRPGAATAEAGKSLFIGLTPNIILLPLWGVLADRWGRGQTFLLALGLTAVAFLTIGFLPTPFTPLMKVCLFAAGYGSGGILILSSTIVNDLSPRPRVATLAGGLASVGALGIILIVTLVGFTFDWKWLGRVQYSSPFLLTGLANAGAFVYALTGYRQIKRRYQILVNESMRQWGQ